MTIQPSPSADRAVVSGEGPGQPNLLSVDTADGEGAVPLAPERTMTLAPELLTRRVQAIRAE